jgi:hypothetical protein
MNTTNLRLGLRAIVTISLLALAAGPLACVAATGPADDEVEPSTSAAPGDKTPLDTTDGDAGPAEQPNGELPDPTSGSPGSAPAYRGGLRQK